MSRRPSKKARKHTYQQQLAVNRTHIPKHPEEEVGCEIYMLGKDWGMGSQFVARKFLCYVSRVDMQRVFPNQKTKQLPQGAMYVKCHRDSYADEEATQYGWNMNDETELDLVNYGRLRHVYLQQHPIQVQEQPAQIDVTGEGDQQQQASSSKKTARVYKYLRQLESPRSRWPTPWLHCTSQALFTVT